MSEAAIECPKCGSPSVRRSRRADPNEMMRMLMGVYPFRCNSCGERFWASVWMFSMWRWAKCPLCLNMGLTDWPKRHHQTRIWQQIVRTLGGHEHRCHRCRHNFVSFRPRLPQYQGTQAPFEPSDDEDFAEAPAVPRAETVGSAPKDGKLTGSDRR